MFGKSEKNDTKSSNSSKNNALEVCHIASGTILTASIKAESNIRLEGTIHGNVTCSGRLVIAASGAVIGDIICKNLDNQGSIEGNIVAKEKIHLRSTAKVTGNVKYKSIQIDEGTLFDGQAIPASGVSPSNHKKSEGVAKDA